MECVYASSDLKEEEEGQLKEKLNGLLENPESLLHLSRIGDGETRLGYLFALNQPCVAVIRPFEEMGFTVLLVIPAISFFSSSLLTTVVLILFVIVSLILYIRYARRKTAHIEAGDSRRKAAEVFRKTVPGALALLAVTCCFLVMMTRLSSRTATI